MNGGTSWSNSGGFGQSQTATSLGIFGNTSSGPGLGAKSASMANLGSLNTSGNAFSSPAKPVGSNSFNNNSMSGGLFGGNVSASNNTSQPSGGLFGNSNNTGNSGFSLSNVNQGNTQATGLFGNSSSGNAPSNSGLLSSTGTNTQTGSLFGNSASLNPSSGGLFGNSNTSNGTSGLFGNSGTANNTLGNALLGKPANGTTTGAGGLFGGSAQLGTTTSSGLFGNSLTSNAGTSSNGGLFGTSNKPATSLFGNSNSTQPTGLFGNSLAAAPSGGLFGNSAANNVLGNNNQAWNINNSVANSDPYKSNPIISTVSNGDLQMPQSITAALFAAKPSTQEHRSSQAEVNPPPKKSSLLGKLAQSFNIFRTSASMKPASGLSNLKGIFTPQNYVTDLTHARYDNISNTKKRPASPLLQIENRNIGDVRKLVIKSKPVQFHLINADKVLSAKRRRVAKPLTTSGFETNVLTDEESSSDEQVARKVIAPKENFTKIDLSAAKEEMPKSTEILEDPNGYFCSPSLNELAEVSMEDLTSVNNFIIGRKGHGQIAYNFPVDLLQIFSRCDSDLTLIKEELFGKIIKIDKTIVRAYDDPLVESPPMGCELNVPATITLVAPPKPTSTIEKHINRLQNITGMDFVTFDPILYNWTFKVKHFSVWGLIDDGEDEADEVSENKRLRELKSRQDAQEEEANNTYSRLYESSEFHNELKRQKVERQTSGLPGGWVNDTFAENSDGSLVIKQRLVQNEINQEINQYKEGQSALVLASNASDITIDSDDESALVSDQEVLNETFLPNEPRKYDYLKESLAGIPTSSHFDDLIDEKAYEPDIEDEQAFELVKIAPNVPSLKDWILQLELANDISSALASGVVIEEGKLALRSVNDILFADISKSSVNLEQASTPIKGKQVSQLTHEPTQKLNTTVTAKLIQTVLLLCKIQSRSNGFPQLTFGDKMSYDTFAGAFSSQEDNFYFELVSVLLDSKLPSEEPRYIETDSNNISLVKHLESIQQRNALRSWLRRFYSKTSLQVPTDPLNAVLYYICVGDLKEAIETAISSNNLHLASLITLLDSNDSAVKMLATRQLESWTNSNSSSLIPPTVVDIHRILAGQYNPLSGPQLPNLEFALRVNYGSNAENLQTIVSEVEQTTETPKLKEVLEMFLAYKMHQYIEAAEALTQSDFSSSFKWILFRICELHTEAKISCDSLTQRFADELEGAGLWKEAVAVASSISDCLKSLDFVRSIILRNIHKMDSSTNDDKQFLESVLKVPSPLIYEAISIEHRKKEDYWGCCTALVSAEMWEDAHDVLCKELGPIAVIGNSTKLTSQFFGLVEKFPDHGKIIPNWNQGAGLFAKFLEIVEPYGGSTISSQGDVLFLLENMALFNVADNGSARVAAKVMSQKIGDIAVENRANILDVDKKIAALKLGENEKRYLSARLLSI